MQGRKEHFLKNFNADEATEPQVPTFDMVLDLANHPVPVADDLEYEGKTVLIIPVDEPAGTATATEAAHAVFTVADAVYIAKLGPILEEVYRGAGKAYVPGSGGSSRSFDMLHYTKGSELKKETWWELYKEKIKRTAVRIESVADGPFREATSFLPRVETPAAAAVAAVDTLQGAQDSLCGDGPGSDDEPAAVGVMSTGGAVAGVVGGNVMFNAEVGRFGDVLDAIRKMPEDDTALPPVDDARFKWYRQIREYERPRVENLSPILWMWAVEVLKNTGCDIGYAAIVAVSALSCAAVGGVWVVGTGFRVPLVTWNAILGFSGCGKSAVTSHVDGLFRGIELESRRRYSEAMEEYKRRIANYNIAKKKHDRGEIEYPGPEPEKPECVTFVIDDATPEATAKAIKANLRGVFGNHNELSLWLGMGRYGKNGSDGERAFHLASYDGGVGRVLRAGEGEPICDGKTFIAKNVISRRQGTKR